ncbi:MAG: type II toxin-antitoxin system RelE/ParE family toxin [Gammaproteobacteria bacterium]|nr:type II toxin-antitoxin system RelE/ParE family toxin [Gammaproteobacteria bacterium]
MAQLIWSNTALDDLNVILEFIALENMLAAKDLAAPVFTATDRWPENPYSGKKIEELKKYLIALNPAG